MTFRRCVQSVAASTLLALSTTSLSAAGSDNIELPTRKGGLWEMTTVMDEGGGPREQTMRMCVEKDMEFNSVHSSIIEHLQNCKKYDVKKSPEITTIDADCKFNGADVSSFTEMRGDFAKSFEVKIKSTTVPPMSQSGKTVPIKRTISQQGTYAGEACGDLQPGEAMGSDGKKYLVQ